MNVLKSDKFQRPAPIVQGPPLYYRSSTSGDGVRDGVIPK